jgi:hypothetical protein
MPASASAKWDGKAADDEHRCVAGVTRSFRLQGDVGKEQLFFVLHLEVQAPAT